jgi:xanthine/uracil permease
MATTLESDNSNEENKNQDLVYQVNERPRSIRDWSIYSLQWVVTMFYAVVWGYALVGIEMGFESAELTRYMSAVVLTIGLSTLIQAWMGHGLAMVSGPNIIPSLAIIAAITAGGAEYARHAFMAQAIAGVAVLALGLFGVTRFIRKVWSPLILGSMVLVVGLAIAGQGLTLLTESGLGWPFFAGLLLALAGTYMALRGPGVWATLPPLIVIGVGYLGFMLFGNFNWDLVTNAPLFVLPQAFPYGLTMPPMDLIAIMIVVNLMAALNLFGNLDGYTKVVGEELTDRRSNRSISVLGVVETILPGVLGTPATVAYGENLGIVMLTRVAARAFIIVASIIFIVLAFIGPMGGLMAAMPGPVAGAVLLGIASTVIGIGAQIMTSAGAFDRREQALVGFSVFLSLGLSLLPKETWEGAPRILITIFSNPVISVILFVMFFEKVLFRPTGSEVPAPQTGAPQPDRATTNRLQPSESTT